LVFFRGDLFPRFFHHNSRSWSQNSSEKSSEASCIGYKGR
jgi:hypothetical protein